MPSTSKDLKIAYQLSISDIIWHILNNPSLSKDMYFGPQKQNLSTGMIPYGPLFDQTQLMISEGN